MNDALICFVTVITLGIITPLLIFVLDDAIEEIAQVVVKLGTAYIEARYGFKK